MVGATSPLYQNERPYFWMSIAWGIGASNRPSSKAPYTFGAFMSKLDAMVVPECSIPVMMQKSPLFFRKSYSVSLSLSLSLLQRSVVSGTSGSAPTASASGGCCFCWDCFGNDDVDNVYGDSWDSNPEPVVSTVVVATFSALL